MQRTGILHSYVYTYTYIFLSSTGERSVSYSRSRAPLALSLSSLTHSLIPSLEEATDGITILIPTPSICSDRKNESHISRLAREATCPPFSQVNSYCSTSDRSDHLSHHRLPFRVGKRFFFPCLHRLVFSLPLFRSSSLSHHPLRLRLHCT